MNDTSDAPDANPGDGVCNAGNNNCTLRAAIMEANALGGSTVHTVNVPAGTYTLTRAGMDEDLASTGDLDIRASIHIIGAGSATTFVQASPTSSATGIDRVFHVISQSLALDVQFSGLTVRYGNCSSEDGGGIRVELFSVANAEPTVSIVNCVITNNAGGRGGGILAGTGNVTIINSTISNNTTSPYNAAGLDFIGDATVVIQNCTISGNVSPQYGGGLGAASAAVVNVTGTTFTGNVGQYASAIQVGAGFVNDSATVHLTNCTLSGNSNGQFPNELTAYTFGTTSVLTMDSTTVANNTRGVGGQGPIHIRASILHNNGTANCDTSAGTGLISDGYNISGDATCTSVFTSTGDLNSTDPKIGALALNAPGITQTHALLAGSPAIDHVPSGYPATDQRGVARPVGAAGDTGAYEYGASKGDFNGDGKTDIVLRNYQSGQDAVWLMNGTTLSSIVDLPALANTAFRIEGTADFNGDGKSDILLRNYTTGQNAIWLMNGTTLLSVVDLPALTNTDYHFEGTGDFNGDGKMDIVLRNYTTGQDALWLMNGTALSSVVDLPALTNTAYRFDAVGDFNGDGKPDIVLRNYSTGQDAVWLMNGTALSSVVDLPALADVNYEINGPR